MFCKLNLDVLRKSIVTLALSQDNRMIVVRYFVNWAPDLSPAIGHKRETPCIEVQYTGQHGCLSTESSQNVLGTNRYIDIEPLLLLDVNRKSCAAFRLPRSSVGYG